MKPKFIILASFFCILLSCKKDKEAPTLTITSPGAGALINGVVNIAGIVKDDELHEMTILITRNSDGYVLFTKDISVHELTTYSFNESYTPVGITVATPVTLIISVEDHVPNVTTKTVAFQLVP